MRFSITKKGYSIQEVDEHIKALEADIAKYKEKDSVINNAIISAQVAADNIVKNAELQAIEIRKKIALRFDGLINSIYDKKKSIKEFNESFETLVEKFLGNYNNEDMDKINNNFDSLEKSILELKDEFKNY
jgi:cell division septum initiation protein DivIVA